jgi:hypothetical protein
MLLPIKPICTAKKVRKDGTAPIFLQYCYSATNRTLLNTGINIPPDCWNNKLLSITKKLPATFGNYEDLNQELLRLKRIAEDLVTQAVKKQVPDKGSFVKNSFSPSLQISAIAEISEIEIKSKSTGTKL